MTFRLGFVFGAVLLASASHAAAQGLTYSAPTECPSEESVVARLRARTGRDSSARVLIRFANGRYHALVSLGDDDDASRTMMGDTCEGVVEAALLVLAMAAPAAEAEAPHTAPPERPSVARPPTPPPDRGIEPRGETRRALPFAIVTGATLAAGAFSEGLWTFDLGANVALEWRRGALDVPWLKPRLALGASTSPFNATIRSPFATSELSRLMGSIEGCPTSHEIGTSVRVAFRPCARVTGSLVWLETTSLIDPNSVGGGSFKTGTWSTAGALARLRFSFDATPMSGGLVPFIEVFGGVDSTLTSERFRILGRSPIAPDAATASFGLVSGTAW